MGDGDHLSNIRKKRTEHKAILTLVLVTLSFMVLQVSIVRSDNMANT